MTGITRNILVICSEPNFTVQEIIQGFYSISIHVFMADGFCFRLTAIFGTSRSEFCDVFWRELHGLAELGVIEGFLEGILM